MTDCDYCENRAFRLIFACKDHVKALDKISSRKEKHSMITFNRNSKAKDKLIEKLQKQVKELEKKQKVEE